MPIDRYSCARISWNLAYFARPRSIWLACLVCFLTPVYSQNGSLPPSWTESAWFGGVVAAVAVLHLQRFMRTGRKMYLVFVAVITLGAWAVQKSSLPMDGPMSDWRMSLPLAHMLFAGAVVAGAWWMANRERAQAALAAAALQSQIASQRDALEKLQASQVALETKVSQRTHELHLAVQQIETLSAQDGLTGVARRRHFD